MPTAWSTILIRSPKSASIVRLAELYLIRTGETCPLKLSITQGSQYNSPPSPQEIEVLVDILNMFISYADRWHTIQIKLRSKFPQGRLLSLSTPQNLVYVRGIYLGEWEQAAQDQVWEAINNSPHLRRVQWINFIPESTPWSQLENVNVMVRYIRPLADLLPRLTNVTSLSMQCGYFPALGPQDFTTELITIPALRLLHLTGYHIYPVLNRIMTPRLQELDIRPSYVRNAYTNPFPSIHTLLTRSNCHLLSLKLRDARVGHSSLLTFLHQSLGANTLTKLETFVLDACPSISDKVIRLLTIPIPDEDIQYPLSLSGMICLPSLRRLSWSIWAPNTAGLLGTMFESRFNHGSLQEASVVLQKDYCHEDDTLTLKYLKERGWNVNWRVH
ncbi:hypothetical protein AX16_007702 [Volvariella volvacea WC 439]|nr:hypothetical protein AX16_007702 [Volvariella volvacea WC 439]